MNWLTKYANNGKDFTIRERDAKGNNRILLFDKLRQYVYNKKVIEEIIDKEVLVPVYTNEKSLKILLTCPIFECFLRMYE